MRSLTLIDEEECVYLYRGQIVSESVMEVLARITERLFNKMAKSEKDVANEEHITKLNRRMDDMNMICNSIEERNARKSKKIAKPHKRFDALESRCNRLEEYFAKQNIRINKRILDIEEFLGDM